MRIMVGFIVAFAVWTFVYWRSRANFETLNDAMTELRVEQARVRGAVDALSILVERNTASVERHQGVLERRGLMPEED